MGNSDKQLLSILATLEGCRAALRLDGNGDTAQLVSVAILDLRTKLRGVSDTELKALCEGIMLADEERPRDGRRQRPLLRLVK